MLEPWGVDNVIQPYRATCISYMNISCVTMHPTWITLLLLVGNGFDDGLMVYNGSMWTWRQDVRHDGRGRDVMTSGGEMTQPTHLALTHVTTRIMSEWQHNSGATGRCWQGPHRSRGPTTRSYRMSGQDLWSRLSSDLLGRTCLAQAQALRTSNQLCLVECDMRSPSCPHCH